jgi:hypothetical protein
MEAYLKVPYDYATAYKVLGKPLYGTVCIKSSYRRQYAVV